MDKSDKKFSRKNETVIYNRSMKNCLQEFLVISETIFCFKPKKFSDSKNRFTKKNKQCPTTEFKFNFFCSEKVENFKIQNVRHIRLNVIFLSKYEKFDKKWKKNRFFSEKFDKNWLFFHNSTEKLWFFFEKSKFSKLVFSR